MKRALAGKPFLYVASLAVLAATLPAAEPLVALPADAPACVRWAAGEAERVVRDRKLPIAAGGIRADLTAEGAAEGFAIAREDGEIRVRARDGTGLMYGLLELAEHLEAGGLEEIEALACTPALAVRAENAFLHVSPAGQVADWFHDDGFWEGYLSLLARSRINVLDLHGAYSPASTGFVHLPTVLVQEQNLARLQRVVALAKARGVRLALMNYLPASSKHRDGEARQVEVILRAVPELWAIGARMKSKGKEAAEAVEDAYLKPARTAGFAGAFVTRSWGTDRKTVERLAQEAGKLYVEVKFNGEHLGLPYPAIEGWGEDYSYQDYLLAPRPFEVLWQVRANGTHRLFPWGDTAFICRAVRAMQLGGAAGFSLEPPFSYYAPELYARYLDAEAPQEGERPRYLFERNWAWHALWGRLAYDPGTPDAKLEALFRVRHGEAAGRAAFAALNAMSRIVPKVYHSYAMGVDHRDAAPELEIGAALREANEGWRSLDELVAIRPLDRMRFASPEEYARARVEGRFEPRIGPTESAAALEALADEADAAAAKLTAALPEAHEAGDLFALAREARALARLGRSHAARLRALVAYAFWRECGDVRWLPLAGKYLAQAATHAQELAVIAGKLYRPFDDPLRAGAGFRFEALQADFERLTRWLDAERQIAQRKGKLGEGEPVLVKLLDAPARAQPGAAQFTHALDGQTALMSLRFPDGRVLERVDLIHRRLDSEAAWEIKAMEWDRKAGAYRTAHRLPEGGLLVHFRGQDAEGRPWLWPDPEKDVPFFHVK